MRRSSGRRGCGSRGRRGDTAPVVAAQDALQTFAADELLVVLPDGEGGREATWLERAAVPGFERLGVPVRYMRASGPQE